MARLADIDVIGRGIDALEPGEEWKGGSYSAAAQQGPPDLELWDEPWEMTINVDAIVRLDVPGDNHRATVIALTDGTRWVVNVPREEIDDYLRKRVRRV